MTEKQGHQWDKQLQSIPHESENFVDDYDDYVEDKDHWETTANNERNEVHSIRRKFNMRNFKGKTFIEHVCMYLCNITTLCCVLSLIINIQF